MARRPMLEAALVLALLASTASAQVVGGSFGAEADPAERVGDEGRFLVVVRNHHRLDADLRLDVLRNAGNLTVSIDPPTLRVPAGGSDAFAVRLALPDGAAPGARHVATLRARDPSLGSAPPVDLALVAPMSPSQPAPAPRPDLAIEAVERALDAASGETVVAAFVVRNTGGTPLHVLLDAVAPDGWRPALDAAALALDPGVAATVQALATVPAGAGGTTARLAVVATAGDLAREAATLVHVAPDAPSEATPRPTPAPEETAPRDPVEERPPAEGARPRPAEPPAPKPEPKRLMLIVSDRLVGPAGGVAVGTVTLLGGDTAERVSLAPSLDAGWAADLQRRLVDVPPHGRVDLWLVVRVPVDAAPKATSPGVVVATGAGPSLSGAFIVEAAEPEGVFEAGATTSLTPHTGGGEPVGAASLVVRDVGRGFERAFDDLAPILLAGGTGLVAGLGLVALAARREAWRIAAASLLAPLYTRLERPGVLGHPDRARILERVAADPGLHFRGLQRALGLHTGALVYHLRVLERHRLLVSRPDGHLVRYFPATGPRVVAPMLRGLRAEVMHAVVLTPGLTQREVADRVNASKQAVHYHVKALIAQGHLRMDVDGGLAPVRSESQPS